MKQLMLGVVMVMVMAVLGMVIVGGAVHNANAEQHACEVAGKLDCHIEWDGFGEGGGWHVYWREP